jgi:hypothetical protein
MVNFKAGFQILVLYLSLSQTGKIFLRKAFRECRQVDKILGRLVPVNLRQVVYFLRTLKLCDKVFSRQVSGRLCSDLERDKSAIYFRFVPYGFFSLLLWGKMLEAFNIPYEEEAQERCVLVAFAHREWDDLFDSLKYSFSDLVKAFDYQAPIPKQLSFLRQLKQALENLAPLERFGAYYQHMQGFDICRQIEYTREKAAIVLEEVAPFMALIFIYAMVPEIPKELKESLPPVARWMYMLDGLADLEHDRLIDRVTYMATVEDPEATMRKQSELCRQLLLRNAPNPDGLNKFLELVTSRVIHARKNGVDIERSFLNLH